MKRASLLLLLICLLSGCHGSGLRAWVPCHTTAEAQALAGARAAPTLEARYGGVVRDTDAEARMASVGHRLCSGAVELRGCFLYRLLDSDCINAFSLPGGRIYITRGLYARIADDELLAAVLAHEMSHLTSNDHFKPRCADAGEVLDREIAADAGGVAYLCAAGYRREAMTRVVRLISQAQPRGWSNLRIAALNETAEKYREKTSLVDTRL